MPPTSSTSRLDELRAANPDLGFGIYALEPRGAVTLEIMTPDGNVYSFTGLSEAEVLDRAFPPDLGKPTPQEPEDPAPAPDIFA